MQRDCVGKRHAAAIKLSALHGDHDVRGAFIAGDDLELCSCRPVHHQRGKRENIGYPGRAERDFPHLCVLNRLYAGRARRKRDGIGVRDAPDVEEVLCVELHRRIQQRFKKNVRMDEMNQGAVFGGHIVGII